VPDLTATINGGFAAYYENLPVKLHKWVDPLTEAQFWRNPFPYGNDIGHLVLHLTGNLNYYIGAQIAQTGYVRERDKEFADEHPPTKAETLQKFDDAVSLVATTIRKQSCDDWSAPYSGRGANSTSRFGIVLDCAAHADHHLGQIINLSRELSRSPRT
jgi:DinB superfamily